MTYDEVIKKSIFKEFTKKTSLTKISKRYKLSIDIINEYYKEYQINVINDYNIIKDLINQKRYDEASDICKKYPYEKDIQKKYVKILREQKRYDEAIVICKRFPNYYKIAAQHIKILMNLKRYDEAFEICKKFSDELGIQQIYIKALIELNRFDEAILICSKFPHVDSVKVLHISILLKLERFTEAHTICMSIDDIDVQNAINKKIENAINEYNEKNVEHSIAHVKQKQEISSPNTKNNNLLTYLRCLKDNTLESSDIEKLSLTYFQKKLLVIIDAYQKRLPERFIKTKIRKLEEEYKDNEIALKTIKKLITLIQNSKNFFDIRKFNELINSTRI